MTKFLLLLGPSGVGKSTLIQELKRLDERFTYISQYITRPLRKGEEDKISISDQTMDKLSKEDQFLAINELYGIRYATPKSSILTAFAEGKFPVLDWPISKIGVMIDVFRDKLLTVYVSPTNIGELSERISKDGRDRNGDRFKEASKELSVFWAGKFNHILDMKVVNKTGQASSIAKEIYLRYIKSLKEGNIGFNKEKL